MVVLCFAYAEYACSAVGADALDGWFAVLERDVRWVLDLYVRLTFYTVCLGHSWIPSEAGSAPMWYKTLTREHENLTRDHPDLSLFCALFW